MATTPNFNWSTPDNTGLVKNGALDIRTLGNSIDASMAELKGGTTGQVLSKTSATDMDFTWIAPSTGSSYVSGKNFIINGAMQIWQRGTSFTSNSSATNYTADRWVGQSNAATTFSRQTTSDTTNLPFIQYCLRVQRNSGTSGTDWINVAYSMETANSLPLAGKTVTVSFYARKGANFNDGTAALYFSLLSGTGTDQNSLVGYTGNATVATVSPTLTTTWQRFSVTGTVSSTATEVGINASFRGAGTAGAADYWEVTGVQLEIASSASAYSNNASNQALELAACQRYFQKTNNQSEVPATAPSANPINCLNASSTLVVGIPPFKTSMRVSPTVTLYSPVTGTSGRIRSGGADVVASVGDVGEYTIGYISATGLTAGSNSSIAFIASAEL